MERKLLLLGLLRAENAHGYHLVEMLEQHLGLSMGLTKPTAYRLLNEMQRDGWLTAHEAREGKRPTKTVYTITEEGQRQFSNLLGDCLERYQQPQFLYDIGLMFLDVLPTQDIVTRLKKRLEAIEALSEAQKAMLVDHPGNKTIKHQLKHLQLDQEHIEQLIKDFEQKGVD